MVKNRYFSNTMGNFSELAIATQVDASDGTAALMEPSITTLSLTVNAAPTAGHILTGVWANIPAAYTGLVPTVEYTVPVAPSTAIANAGVKAAIEAALANVPGASVQFTGTTTQVITISAPGSAFNGVTLTLASTGNSFTAPGVATFAGGIDADATAADNIKDFVDNALAGSIWAFWDDTKLALKAGDTALPANVGRKYFYAWKQGVATEYNKSTAIPVKDLVKDSVAYNAGTAQVSTGTFTGTYAIGQIIHLRIIDTTGTILPYPSFEYEAACTATSPDAALAAIVVKINAEALGNTPIVTATSAAGVITITAKTKLVTFDLAAYLEVIPGATSDGSVFAKAVTVKAKAPIGDIASVTELQKYYIMNNGGVQYSDHSIQAYEFGAPTTNVGTNSVTQFGFLLLRQNRTEHGETRGYTNRAYMLIAIKNTDLATLAAL